MCTGDYPSWRKNIDSVEKRSSIRPSIRSAVQHTRSTQRYVRVAAAVRYSHTSNSQPASQRGYRFDSSHSSKSNKKLIESVTPPDFTNEISKYQFHVTLFVLAYLATLAGWPARDRRRRFECSTASRKILNWNKMSCRSGAARTV